MNKKRIFSVLVAGLLACTMLVGGCGGQSDVDPSGDNGGSDTTVTPSETDLTVTSIAIGQTPTKSAYYVGETFSAEGGTIIVTYSDGSTNEISLTADGVSLSTVNTNSKGTKTVTVTYEGQKCRFTITVSAVGYDVTYDYNYEGSESTIVNVEKNGTATEPTAPTRTGYTFYKWYTDADCTVEYDFSTAVTSAITLYAQWKDDSATYYKVTYDLNYYGVLPTEYSQVVKSGDSARTLALTPSRDEYTFDGWYSDASGSSAYVTTSSITADTTIYAKWTKTKTGSSTYVFEAEDTDLRGKEGPGLSGSATANAMIVNDVTNLGASGGKYISYLYKYGLTLDFYIASSEAVNDATLTLSISAELDGVTLSPSNYMVMVNGDSLNYSSVSLTAGGAFGDYITISNVSLKEGANSIVLFTNNSVNPLGEGMGTYQGTAPIVDCIKITTSAVLIWDANYELPFDSSKY